MLRTIFLGWRFGLFVLLFVTCIFLIPSIVFASDPTYQWTKITTGGLGYGHRVAVDDGGNVYMAGDYWGTVDFGVGEDSSSRTANGRWDGFVTKYDIDGNRIWTKTFGGTEDDEGYSITTDKDGNIYVTGAFKTTVDFGAGGDTASRTSNGAKDAYITKYESNGTRAWTKTFGGNDDWMGDTGSTIATDTEGKVYLVGVFVGTVDFGAGGDTASRTSIGINDNYITKYNPDGTRVWTKTFDTNGGWINTDSSNNIIFVAGLSAGTIDFGAGEDERLRDYSDGPFSVSKFQSDGTRVWTKTFGGADSSGALYNVAADSSGNIFIVGEFRGTVDFGAGGDTASRSAGDGLDVFLSKYQSDGTRVWTKTFGGTDTTNSDGIAIDTDGNIYLAALFSGTVEFNPGATDPISITSIAEWGYSMYITAYDNSGNYLWTRTSLGGNEADNYGIDVYGDSIFVAGVAYGNVDFDPQGSHDVIDTLDGAATLIKYILPITEVAQSIVASPTVVSSVNSSSGHFVCTLLGPITSPDLFQINTTRKSATLYFAPVVGPISDYYVSYGIKESVWIYGAKFSQGQSSGVLSYKINELVPNRVYYFKIMGGSGCATGPWSNTMKIITSGNNRFYKYLNK